MSEPRVVEFELNADQLVRLLPREHRINVYTMLMILTPLAGLIVFVLGILDHRDRMEILGVFIVLVPVASGMFYARIMSRVRRALATRLAGATRVSLSDNGFEYVGANVEEFIEWSRVGRLADRREAWVILAGEPSVTRVIPKSAIPPDRRKEFASRLAAWSGEPLSRGLWQTRR